MERVAFELGCSVGQMEEAVRLYRCQAVNNDAGAGEAGVDESVVITTGTEECKVKGKENEEF